MSEQPQTRRARRESAESTQVDDLLAYAREWADDDPDVATAQELRAVIEAAESGDEAALADLADRCRGLLEFGTAGLRGELGAGPNRMNRAVVLRAAAGLVAYLKESVAAPTVVIGFDARLGSAQFAADTAAVVTGAGGKALVLPRPLPTPVLAYAIRRVGADAGVMVTASHNPAQDNGYKVYLGDGSQIVPPADTDIRRHIERVRRVADLPLGDGGEVVGEDLIESYAREVAALVPADAPRDVAIVHTSMHGVGHDTVLKVFAAAGFPAPTVVAEQAQPDPTFPTVPFPNPEETGAIDMALALAKRTHPHLVIANDPDADRCAAAVPDPAHRTDLDPAGWRMLRGDELGALLAWDVIAGGVSPDDVLARSIVSSRLTGAMARAAGCRAVETLTGFKWISRAEGLRYGYEEAIGYCVAPQLVRDKDGISAAVRLAALVARLKAQGRSVVSVLDELAVQHGVYATDAFSVRVEDLSLIGRIMERLRGGRDGLGEVAGLAVAGVDDLAAPTDGLPPTDGLRYRFADDSRVIVRPSGTEPKLKIYLEVIEPVAGPDALAAARGAAAERLAVLKAAFTELTAI